MGKDGRAARRGTSRRATVVTLVTAGALSVAVAGVMIGTELEVTPIETRGLLLALLVVGMNGVTAVLVAGWTGRQLDQIQRTLQAREDDIRLDGWLDGIRSRELPEGEDSGEWRWSAPTGR